MKTNFRAHTDARSVILLELFLQSFIKFMQEQNRNAKCVYIRSDQTELIGKIFFFRGIFSLAV
jgi:hypothetical protein